jgi:hypothetical protein
MKRTRAAAAAVLECDGTPAVAWRAADAISTATFAGIDDEGFFHVELPGTTATVTASSTVALTAADRGARVLIVYADGDALTPIVVGLLHERAAAVSPGLIVDGERLVIKAEREIELRCGEASIVLTRAGKVLIRGNYVLTRSRGANRIKGAFVDIN